jgi:hypothetical protein
MRAFNPTASAQEAIDAGLVFEDLHGSLYLNLAGRADLEPGSQQLLVGGIGSGKTTELLLAMGWLRSQDNVLPLYIDITSETDLSALNSGSLLASLGIHLSILLLGSPTLPKEAADHLKGLYEKIKEYAYGKTERVWVEHDDWQDEREEEDYDDNLDDYRGYYTTRNIPGKLQPPLPKLQRDIRSIREPLEHLLTSARETYKDIVVVFDGLDRLLVPDRFVSVVFQDLRVLRSLKISVLATAPISILYGVGSSVAEHFDRVQHLAVVPADPGDGFLQSVIERRGGYELLAREHADAVCHYSGGVLRDLISLARDAAEEAYVSGHGSIESPDVEKAVQQLGTSYLRGVGPEALKTLAHLDRSRSFPVNLPANVELLVTRRVLEYSSTDFRVHPALLSVMPKGSE